MSYEADKLPFRSDASAMRSGSGPEGALSPFKERGQVAPGGADIGAVIESPDATGSTSDFPKGTGGFPARLRG